MLVRLRVSGLEGGLKGGEGWSRGGGDGLQCESRGGPEGPRVQEDPQHVGGWEIVEGARKHHGWAGDDYMNNFAATKA